MEINQLNKLRERKLLIAKLGIQNKATIVTKFPAKQLTNKAIKVKSSAGEKIKSNSVTLKSSKDDQSKEQVNPQFGEVIDNKLVDSAGKKVRVRQKKSGQGFSSPFLHFVHKNKLELNKNSPGASVNKAALRKTWKTMDESGKKEFFDESLSEKLSIGIDYRKDIKDKSLGDVEKKERKAEHNRKYQECMKKKNVLKTQEDDVLEEEVKVIVSAKENKLSEMIEYVERLKTEVVKTQKLNKEIAQSVAEKEVGCLVVKEQFKALHKVHKNCLN